MLTKTSWVGGIIPKYLQEEFSQVTVNYVPAVLLSCLSKTWLGTKKISPIKKKKSPVGISLNFEGFSLKHFNILFLG